MSNRTERDQGFGPVEMRSGVADFPGWRGLLRVGDPVLRPGRFYRLWNAQISDGEIQCRGGQTLFSDMGSDETRPNCITSIFSSNPEWPDLGQGAEIRLTEAVNMATQSFDEPNPDVYSAYRGDIGQFATATPMDISGSRRQRWLRDGVNNTSSGAETTSSGNSSIRIRERVYVANLSGSISYLDVGTASYTILAAVGAQFGADSRPLAMTYLGKLVICGDGVIKTYDIDAGTWTSLAMPGGTTNFVPKGWTVFDVDDCLYIWGTVVDDAKLLKYDGTTVTVSYTAPAATGFNQAIDCASNNGNIVISYTTDDTLAASFTGAYSPDGVTFTTITLVPDTFDPEFSYFPTRMVVADGMIWSVGLACETGAPTPIIMFSYDGTEWLSVLSLGVPVEAGGGVFGPVDIVQIAPVDTVVTDTTEL